MILVTGGAGYIGSHALRALMAAGIPPGEIIVLDTLYSGHLWALPKGVNFVKGSSGEKALLSKIFNENKVDSVFHFAAHLEVEESVRDPFKYYSNNFLNSCVLIDASMAAKVSNFVFSSTCAVVGSPKQLPVDETASCHPESPYGKSKLMTEWYLADVAKAAQIARKNSMNFVALRYFNVAGAHFDGSIGQATPRATQLVKVACEVAVGKRKSLLLYGSDYLTRDGTCVRDYIHVDDLAEAHVLALDYLKREQRSEVINLGYGHGYSVREIIDTVKKVSDVDFRVEEVARRPGDVEIIFADASKAKKLLGWVPKYDDIEHICRTTLDWEKSYTEKPLAE